MTTAPEPTWLSHAHILIDLGEIKGPRHESLIFAIGKAIRRGGLKGDETA